MGTSSTLEAGTLSVQFDLSQPASESWHPTTRTIAEQCKSVVMFEPARCPAEHRCEEVRRDASSAPQSGCHRAWVCWLRLGNIEVPGAL
jgi:hypothetical protein